MINNKTNGECINEIVNNPAYYCTNTQYKFYMCAKNKYNIELDMKSYKITRGRGWSKSDGSCGAAVFDKEHKHCYLLFYPLRNYLRKNISWDFYDPGRNDRQTGGQIGIELKKDGRK